MTTRRVARPESHDNCLLCGDLNRFGLGLKFHANSDGSVYAKLNSKSHHQGYEGILHGGFVASLLDSAMCNALFEQGIEAVTGDMSIRFFDEIPYDSEVELVGKVKMARSPLFKVEAELMRNGKIVAKAEARFVKRGLKK